MTGLLVSLGAEFGRTTGVAGGWHLTGELAARCVREAELRLPGLTHGEGMWWSRVSGDRALRQAHPLSIVPIRQQDGLARHLAGIRLSTKEEGGPSP
ncbi:hypothetical protein [Streptomyces sp. B21-083]|uniref:hypothetical protein n=1 Tax=Streptomyces sp. B21-083 TaxID=3039410 RepID=UPI003FA71E7C